MCPKLACYQGCCWRSCSNWFRSTVWITRIHCSQHFVRIDGSGIRDKETLEELKAFLIFRKVGFFVSFGLYMTDPPPSFSWKRPWHYHQTEAFLSFLIRIGPSWWRPCGLCVQKLCWKAVKSLAFRVPHQPSTKESIFVTRSYLVVDSNIFLH